MASGQVNAVVEDDAGSIGQQVGFGAQTQETHVEVRPFGTYASGEGIKVVEAVGQDVDEGPRGVARIEPDTTEQVSGCGADVSVRVVQRLYPGSRM